MARPHALGTGRLGRDLLPLALVEQTFRKPTPSVRSCSERERRGPQPAHKGTGRRPSVHLRTEPVSVRTLRSRRLTPGRASQRRFLSVSPKLRPQSWAVPMQLPARKETRGPAPKTRNGRTWAASDGRPEGRGARAGARAEPFAEARSPAPGGESCKGAEPAQALGAEPETGTMETSTVRCLFL